VPDEAKGFAVVVDGKFADMELSEDLVAGIVCKDPIPVFKDKDDADEAFRQYCGLYGTKYEGGVVPVVVKVTGPVEEVAWDEEWDDGEDEDEDEDEDE